MVVGNVPINIIEVFFTMHKLMQLVYSPTSTFLHGCFLCIVFTPTLLHVLTANGSTCLNSSGLLSLVRGPSSITAHIILYHHYLMMANQSQFAIALVLASKNIF